MVHGGQGQATNHAHAVYTHGAARQASLDTARVPAEQIILETAAATLSFLLQHAYISVILHILLI